MKLNKELRPLSRQQLPQADALLGRAFFHDPLSVYVFPDEPERTCRVSLLYSIPLHYALRYGEVMTTSELAGVACWLPPEHTAVSDKRMLRAGVLTTLFKIGLAALRRSGNAEAFMKSSHQRALSKPHWYLWVLGVDPVYQGQGVGGALLRAGLAHADASHLPCYLETTNAENVPFYQRFGFLVEDERLIPDSSVHLWSMIRPAHANAYSGVPNH